MERILQFAKTLIRQCTDKGSITIDCTVGNGNDTLFLAELVTHTGKVYGFDIQLEAIHETEVLLKNHGIEHVRLIHKGHEELSHHIPKEEHKKICSAIFNLGYLPKGNHQITTKKETTIKAILQLLQIIKINGIIVIVIYPGHKEGKEEMEAIIDFTKDLNPKHVQVLKYQFINLSSDAPFIIAIEKSKEVNI